MCRHPWLFSFAALACSSVARADSISIAADADNSIYSESLNSGGAATTFFSGRNNAAGVRRGLLRFDVAGQLPADATITGATLTLNMDGAAQTETQARDIGLHRLLADWGEGTSGGGGPGGGQGQPPATSDATWQHRFFDSQSWTTPGGDFDAAASGIASIGTAPGLYSWPSTAALVSDVQVWLDDPATNFGWALVGNESVNGTVRRFNSREVANQVLSPALTIEFQSIPEPATLALLLSTLLCVAFFRRR